MMPWIAVCACAMVWNGAARVPGLLSLPVGETKKFALGACVTVICEEAVALESVTEVAVTVTVPPEGTVDGAV